MCAGFSVAPLHFVHAAADPARNDTMTEFRLVLAGMRPVPTGNPHSPKVHP
jgi:hypothetical protein